MVEERRIFSQQIRRHLIGGAHGGKGRGHGGSSRSRPCLSPRQALIQHGCRDGERRQTHSSPPGVREGVAVVDVGIRFSPPRSALFRSDRLRSGLVLVLISPPRSASASLATLILSIVLTSCTLCRRGGSAYSLSRMAWICFRGRGGLPDPVHRVPPWQDRREHQRGRFLYKCQVVHYLCTVR